LAGPAPVRVGLAPRTGTRPVAGFAEGSITTGGVMVRNHLADGLGDATEPTPFDLQGRQRLWPLVWRSVLRPWAGTGEPLPLPADGFPLQPALYLLTGEQPLPAVPLGPHVPGEDASLHPRPAQPEPLGSLPNRDMRPLLWTCFPLGCGCLLREACHEALRARGRKVYDPARRTNPHATASCFPVPRRYECWAQSRCTAASDSGAAMRSGLTRACALLGAIFEMKLRISKSFA
jgi:hypothetical protein